MRKVGCVFAGLLFLSFHIGACGNKTTSVTQDTVTVQKQAQFPLPELPTTLTEPEARKAYLLTHYWDKFDFADTTLVNNRNVTEQGFVNFIALLLDETTTKELTGKSLTDWCTHFLPYPHSRQVMTQLTDDYLYNPNSPYYNEPLYGMYLETLLNVLPQTDAMRSSYQFRLELLRRNNVGDKATDFTYYNPQIQFFAKSETKRPKIELSHKTKRSENRKRTTQKMQPEKVAFLVSTNRLKQALKWHSNIS